MYTIYITPRQADRPRLSNRFGIHNTGKYDAYKKALALHIKRVVGGNVIPDKEAISLNLIFYMPIPESLSKKKQEERLKSRHIKTPDTSNLLKAFEDAAKGILYIDDSQIDKISVKKEYSFEPRIEFEFSYG